MAYYSSIVVDHLQNRFSQGKAGVVYTYFDYKDAHSNVPVEIMCRLLKQLLTYPHVCIPLALEELYKSCAMKNAPPQLSDLDGIFKAMSTNFSVIYLVVDAFDECASDQQSAVLKTLRDLTCLSSVRLLVTSRPHQTFIQASNFEDARIFEIKAHEEDVQRYLSTELTKAKHLSPGIKERIMQVLQNRVDGT